MATLKEKIGYGFGDMSSSMFWKIFSYYLPMDSDATLLTCSRVMLKQNRKPKKQSVAMHTMAYCQLEALL